jgi:hypothetical protein
VFVGEEPLRTQRAPAAYRGDWDHEPCTWYQDVDDVGPRYQWDARRTGELLSWHGLERVPGFDRAGRRQEQQEQVVYGLHDVERFVEAWASVGVEVPAQRVTRFWALGYWFRLQEVASRSGGAGVAGRRCAGGGAGAVWWGVA